MVRELSKYDGMIRMIRPKKASCNISYPSMLHITLYKKDVTIYEIYEVGVTNLK